MTEWSKWETYFIYDKPIPYKKLVIYPVIMRDYLPFFYFAECLTLDKNAIPDVKIIGMNYYEYIYSKHTKETPYIAYFDALLKIVLRRPDLNAIYRLNEKGKPIFIIDDTIYDVMDFDELRLMIAQYNNVELPNDKIQLAIREAKKKADEIRGRNSAKMASLEDQIVAVMLCSSLTTEQIYDLPIRKFIKILERADLKLHYSIYLSASMSGMVEFKDKDFIKHWLSEIKKDETGLVPVDALTGPIEGKKFTVRK
jgi:hypothetical protein